VLLLYVVGGERGGGGDGDARRVGDGEGQPGTGGDGDEHHPPAGHLVQQVAECERQAGEVHAGGCHQPEADGHRSVVADRPVGAQYGARVRHGERGRQGDALAGHAATPAVAAGSTELAAGTSGSHSSGP
jgi:hypothetical protein